MWYGPPCVYWWHTHARPKEHSVSLDLDYDTAIDYQIEEWENTRMHEIHDQGTCAGPGWCNWCGDDIPTEF